MVRTWEAFQPKWNTTNLWCSPFYSSSMQKLDNDSIDWKGKPYILNDLLPQASQNSLSVVKRRKQNGSGSHFTYHPDIKHYKTFSRKTLNENKGACSDEYWLIMWRAGPALISHTDVGMRGGDQQHLHLLLTITGLYWAYIINLFLSNNS